MNCSSTQCWPAGQLPHPSTSSPSAPHCLTLQSGTRGPITKRTSSRRSESVVFSTSSATNTTCARGERVVAVSLKVGWVDARRK